MTMYVYAAKVSNQTITAKDIISLHYGSYCAVHLKTFALFINKASWKYS